MMETRQLRQADFVTSILLFFFGVWILFEAFQMPMRDTYGGVRNVWYVSPALMPLIVGFGITILSIVLMVHSVRTGGATRFLNSIHAISLRPSEGHQRFLGVVLALVTFVYFSIPRIDFALSIALFLTYFVPAYYYDSISALRKLSGAYVAIFLLLALLYGTGLAAALNETFEFATDVVALVAIVGLTTYARVIAGRDTTLRSRFRLGLTVSIVVPLVLTPVFRFALFVPLPHEGGIVQLMQLIYYSLR